MWPHATPVVFWSRASGQEVGPKGASFSWKAVNISMSSLGSFDSPRICLLARQIGHIWMLCSTLGLPRTSTEPFIFC
jgi:hypothetical protein